MLVAFKDLHWQCFAVCETKPGDMIVNMKNENKWKLTRN